MLGLGPLCSQLQHVLKEQERAKRSQHDLEVKVLSSKIEGAILQANCQLEQCRDVSITLPKTLMVLVKTDNRLQASPGDTIFIRKPWQRMDVDGTNVLLVQHADSNHKVL